MSIYHINFLGAEELSQALAKLGADSRCLPFFDNRREIKALCIPDVDARGAGIIKQELLSRGGDAAVSAGVVSLSVKHSDCILFGTKKQLFFLAEKMAEMPWWGFPEISAGIKTALNGLEARARAAELPGGRTLPLGERTLIMGITNLTGDSFFSGSRTGSDVDLTLQRVEKQILEGADIIDLGAESTRPGSVRAEEEEEEKRVSAAVKAVRKEFPSIPISVDTTRLRVAEAALAEGADIINDISGLSWEPELAGAAAEHKAMLVLMHMRGTPETMRELCDYGDLFREITLFFGEGIKKAESMGLDKSRIILDPGIGFAKNYGQNLLLLRHPEAFRTFGLPLLIGASRKGVTGAATASEKPEERLAGTMAISALCAWQNIEIVRVHDVLENKKAVMMIDAIKKAKYE